MEHTHVIFTIEVDGQRETIVSPTSVPIDNPWRGTPLYNRLVREAHDRLFSGTLVSIHYLNQRDTLKHQQLLKRQQTIQDAHRVMKILMDELVPIEVDCRTNLDSEEGRRLTAKISVMRKLAEEATILLPMVENGKATGVGSDSSEGNETTPEEGKVQENTEAKGGEATQADPST